jgi:hypothetical protein
MYRKYYFQSVSTLLLILSLIAFSDNLITDVGQPSNKDPKFIIHGLLMFAWFGTFVAQTYFILTRKFDAHIKWGKIGFVLAIAVFLSTVYVFITVFQGWGSMEPFVKANRLFMVSFAFFLLLAYRNRGKGARHKRFVFWAIVLPIEPIMGRVSDFFNIDHWVLFYALGWHLFFASFLLYDWQTLKRIHPISWAGLVWFYLVWILALYS